MSNHKARSEVLKLLLARLQSFSKLVEDEVKMTVTKADEQEEDLKELLHRMMGDVISDLTAINAELQEIRELTATINAVMLYGK